MTEPTLEGLLNPPKPDAARVVGRVLAPDRAGPYAQRALTAELNALGMAPEGQRNAQLNTSGFNLSQLVEGGYLEGNVVWDALYATAIDIGLTASESLATLRSSFAAGARQPRVVADQDSPPAPVATVLDEEVEIAVTEDGYLPVLDWDELWATKATEEWVLEPLVPARRLVALFSAPKVGKSLLMLELAVKISNGHRFLGNESKQVRVLYVDFENDPHGDVKTRLLAMGLTPFQLRGLDYMSFPTLPFLDTAMGGLVLMENVAHYKSEVVVIDTVSRAVGGEENSNDTWLAFYKHTGMRLKAAGVGCIRLDHSGKDLDKGMRGGSAKYGDVDAVWQLTKVSEETYKLECTANRLEVSDKVIVLKREVHPNLHHVYVGGEAAEWEAKDEACLEELDRLFDAEPVGANEAQAALKGSGKSRARTRLLHKILPERERRHGRYGDGQVIA